MQLLKALRHIQRGLLLGASVYYFLGFQMSEASDAPETSNSGVNPASILAPIKIIDSIPQPDAGIRNSIRVHHDTSFAVLIETEHGISWTDPDSLRFLIFDGLHKEYQRDLDSPAVRVVAAESVASEFELVWVVYDRSLDRYLPPFYPLEAIVQIQVDIRDLSGNSILAQTYAFRIESDSEQALGFDHLPESETFTVEDPVGFYDTEIEIIDGHLAGARVLFNGNEPFIPAFGPIDEIESATGIGDQAVGIPLNLMPHTVFNRPVKLFIPFPEGSHTGELDIYYHNGARWLLACDAEGNLLAGGKGWMVPGSRVDHAAQNPPLVEIEVYHFSAAQAVISGSSTTTDNIDRERHGSGATVVVSCFIDATDSREINLIGLLGLLGLLGWIGKGLKRY